MNLQIVQQLASGTLYGRHGPLGTIPQSCFLAEVLIRVWIRCVRSRDYCTTVILYLVYSSPCRNSGVRLRLLTEEVRIQFWHDSM
jgi:hypothetical protein